MIRESITTDSSFRHLLRVVLLSLVALPGQAGVTVIQNVAPGATSWPGSPLIQTVANPAAEVAVGESFNAVGGCTNYAQTFTVTGSNFTLQAISIYAGGGTGTGAGTNITLRLFDLGPQTAPNPSPYAAGGDLFNSGNGLSISYTPQPLGVLQFDFTDSDQVTLTNGRLYAFEIGGVLNSSPVAWHRTISDTYAAGAAYRNRSWINGNNAREFALAVYGTSPDPNPPPSTNVTLVKFEAESGTLGPDWGVNNGVPTNITITTDGGGDNPGSAARVVTYVVTFPMPGTYDLYARLRVGVGGGNDDSLFCGNGFGSKDPATAADWITVNGLGNRGFTNPNSIVTDAGTAGTGVWKWINLSQFTGENAVFSVASGNLTQTFQIGARENGLDLDAFVFGITGVSYTVTNLDAGAGGTFPDGNATINWNVTRQRIDGFGGGVVFLNDGSSLTEANADKLFLTNTASQLGLSILRVRIAPNSNWSNSVAAWSSSLTEARRAVDRGAAVLASPWTPPTSLKDTNSLIGGRVPASQYANYAAYLDTYAKYLRTNGAPLVAVSVQNEPDITVSYESCDWTAEELRIFFRDHAGVITNAPMMMPESFRFNPAVSDAALNDPVAVTNIAIVGGHLYGVNTITPYNNAHAKGKPTWMTEYLINDQSIETAIDTASQIHDCLTTGNMSAYIWWKCLGNINGLLNASGVIQKRGYVMAQFSRFVRPGFLRINESNSGSGRVSAYRNPNNDQFAIIAINPFSLAFDQTISLTGFPPAVTLTPWITSGSQSLATQGSFPVTNGVFTYRLPPLSVITFVGVVNSNAAPGFLSVGPQTVNPGVTMLITNAVTDPDLPAQTLTFTLLAAPANATLTTLNASNALFTWRPLITQAASTNAIQVKVADNGAPSLSATNAFIITVNPAGQPELSSISSGSSVSLSATGIIGPDYLLLTSTNLVNWELLSTTTPVAMPVTFTDTNRHDAARFYRLQLGP